MKSLWHHQYIYVPAKREETWEQMGGEGGCVESWQVRIRQWRSNEQGDFHWSEVPRRKLCFIPRWQGIPLSCWSKIIGLISLKAKWQWSSPQFADIYAITRPLSIPLTTTETCMATMKIQQDHDSQHTTCSELLRKPVWKLQACCSIPRFMALGFSLDLCF